MTAYTDPEIITIRRHCDTVNPPIPGGCKCPFPKCYHEACAAVIADGLRKNPVKSRTLSR